MELVMDINAPCICDETHKPEIPSYALVLRWNYLTLISFFLPSFLAFFLSPFLPEIR